MQNDTRYLISIASEDSWEKVEPNFIYNRYDLCDYEKSVILFVKDNESSNVHYIPLMIGSNKAFVGGWLTSFKGETLECIADWIFSNYKAVMCIEVARCCLEGKISKNHCSVQKDNDWHIELPDSSEELDKRLSQKGRYNLRREKRLLESSFEGVSYKHEPAENALDVVETFFQFKRETHAQDFHKDASEYVTEKCITDIYYIDIEGKVISVILSCNQCPCVYCENMSYSLEYREYSPGKLLYDWYLKELIRDKKKSIFLSGGDLEYKTRYGSVETEVCDIRIYRSCVSWCVNERLFRFPELVWNCVPEKGKKALRYVIRKSGLRDFNHI